MIKKFGHRTDLEPTSNFPHAKFEFEKFNCVQSRVFEFYDKPVNALIAAATSSGKTVVAEMMISDEVRRRGGKAVYLSPLRALSQEKIDDWTCQTHHFSDLRLSICTGDYRLTSERRQELEDANIIIMTSEMLNSRARNHKSENNSFLQNAGTVVLDESHLLGVDGRGSHLESGLMKFTEMNPEARIVMLSATMPNVEEIARWVSKLNGKDTYLVESDYRPCKLNLHYEKYRYHWNYDTNEKSKISNAASIMMRHPKDKFLLFVHTKRTGSLLVGALQQMGIEAEFHNADLDKAKRIEIETRFREDSNLRAIVATSTIAWGCNLPARRVIILGVHRGISLVENYDILQMVGRSGRPKYDPEGDAYILLPDNKFGEHYGRLQKPEPIRSRIAESHGSLAFHIVSEIHHGNIKTVADIHRWFSRTLASFQNKSLSAEVIDKVIQTLSRCGAIKDVDGTLAITPTGAISSMFYFSPFDVSDLARNWTVVFDRKKEGSDHWLAFALANVNSHKQDIVSSAERPEVEAFLAAVHNDGIDKAFGGKDGIPDGVMKTAHCYHLLLTGGTSHSMTGYLRTVQNDFDRVAEVLGAVDAMVLKKDKKEYFRSLAARIKYGVSAELVDLCRLPGVGKARAKRLWDNGIRSPKDVAENPMKVLAALRLSKAKAQKLCMIAAHQRLT